MKVSVIIPAYNEEKYIKNCIESVLNQEVEAHEIIVIDNNCSDSTIDIAQEYPVNIIKEEKQGLTHARNKGFNTATGDYLVKIDADTILHSQYVKDVIRFSEGKKNFGGMTGNIRYYDSRAGWFFHIFDIMILKYFTRLLLGHYIMIGPNMVIAYNAWQDIKDSNFGDDSYVHEDMDISRFLAEKYTIYYIPKLYNYVSARRFKDLKSYIVYPVKYMQTVRRNIH